jgi:hypothetical protein
MKMRQIKNAVMGEATAVKTTIMVSVMEEVEEENKEKGGRE